MKNHLFLIVFAFTGSVFAQTPATLTFSTVSSGDHTATQSITLLPGFQSTSFSATILPDAYIPIVKSDENYVYTKNFQTAMSTALNISENKDVIEGITYFDGLGRPMQQIGIKASPDKKDITTYLDYDQYGRQTKQYLPYEAAGTIASYRTDALAATNTHYTTHYSSDINAVAPNPFSETLFEASPLNRPEKQAAPGYDWRHGGGHEIGFDYQTNVASEVRLFTVTLAADYTPTLVGNGTIFYAAGELYKSITLDENHDGTAAKDHTTEEFTDKLGRVVLKRTYESGMEHDTYYVYDDHGNLTYVLPPKVVTSDGVSATELAALCYQYRYDLRNRLIEKQIPGKGREYIVYNKLDQPIMTQDTNLANNSKWLFSVYDAFGRLAYTGLDSLNSSNRSSMQTGANGAASQFVTKTTSGTTYAGTLVYYSKDAYPTDFDEVHTINYYDNYTFDTDGLSVPATVLGEPTVTNVQGLPTGSKVRVLGTSDWITTITGYDKKGRPIYVASKNNYLGTEDIIETQLDFAGKLLKTTTTHKKTGNADIVTVDIFEYDHSGRLLTQTQTLAGQTELITANSYDKLGQLTSKKTGNTEAAPLQTVDYSYNVRGWLKQINDPASLGSDLFAFGINYNTVAHGGTALFNGNIAETEWKTQNDNALRWYKYGYDALNRIKTGIDNTVDQRYSLTAIGYDKNGNITALSRNGHTDTGATSFGVMDDLAYSYDSGNKLLKVADAATIDGFGFKDDAVNTTADTANDYTYDINGNMLTNTNKGITDISYNHLNLPLTITINDGGANIGNISYIYDATGIKQRKIVSTGTTTDYAANFIYENGSLKFFNHPEGYMEPDGSGGYDYVYNYKDHLGNIRLAYSDMNNNGTVDASEIREENNYYPFGLKHKGYNNIINGTDNPYGFGGKEEQNELGLNWIDITTRNYDPALGRWMNIDPLAEAMSRHSPYNFAFDNPVYFVDPDGMMPCPNEDCDIEDTEQEKPKEITEKDIDNIVDDLPDNFTTGDMLNAVVGALNENENATIKGSTIKSFSEKKAKEQLSKLDPNNPDDAKQIEIIKEGLKSSENLFKQIDRVDKKANEITVVPTGTKIVIKAKVNITINKDNKITIQDASSSGVKLKIEGIRTSLGKVKRATITRTGYEVKVGIFPSIQGEF